jgi:hypothetical protein
MLYSTATEIDLHTVLRWRLSDDVRAQIDAWEVTYRAKEDSRFWRALGRVWPAQLERFWTLVRLPFGRPVIWVPPSGVSVTTRQLDGVTLHELHHVRQVATWWGLVLVTMLNFALPLPVLLSGRWFVERRAYLGDIRRGGITAEDVAELLWSGYLWPWPRSWMRRWFEAELAKPDRGGLF